MNIHLLIYLLITLNHKIIAHPIFSPSPAPAPEIYQHLARMTLEEKIGQLFIIAALSDHNTNQSFISQSPYTFDEEYIRTLITQYHAGGVLFLGHGTKESTKNKTIDLQKLSPKIPLFVALDAEWGLSMRLVDGEVFPKNNILSMLNAQDEQLIYEMGYCIGTQLQELGVHINFAPVIDVNTNPSNPIINVRSFGNDPERVGQLATLYAHGLHDAGIMACAKHFPGHGDTTVDSHVDLPVITHNKQRLQDIELIPFKCVINTSIPCIMTAHLAVPTYEDNLQTPASLSYAVVTELLKNKLGFNGLIVTDGLGMCGVTKHFAPGELELKALLAGNDMLLAPIDMPYAVQYIKDAIVQNIFSIQELDMRVIKILQAKQWAFTQAQKKYKPTHDPKQLHQEIRAAAQQTIAARP